MPTDPAPTYRERTDSGVPATLTTWQLLRRETAFAWFMAGLVPGAVVIGLASVTRVRLATEVFGDEVGVATTAIAGGLAAAAAGLVVGTLVDRGNARWVLVASTIGIGATQGATYAVFAAGMLSVAMLTTLALVEGFFIGVAAVALLTTQAGLVPLGQRGAAEITNALRIGIGSIIGTVLAASLLPLAVSLAASGVITVAVAVIAAWTSRGFVPAARGEQVSLRTVLATAVQRGPLRSILIVDAVFALVLPTQLVNLLIVDKDLADLLGLAVVSGIVGVLAARLHLSFTGLRGSLQRRVRRAILVYLAVLPIAWLVLVSGSVTLITWTAAPLIVWGSWSATLAAGLVSATAQERLPDRMRGRFSGALNAVRSGAAAGGVFIATLVITPQATETFLAVLAGALVVVFAISRGFAALRDRPAEPHA